MIARSLRTTLAPLAAVLFALPVPAQIVNAPVAPDTIYVVRSGAQAGLSVIDLNGFGASTGNPAYDPTYTVIAEGDSNYPNNPNVKLQGALLRPPLVPGTTTLDGGSAGVFRLTLDSALGDLHLRAPAVLSIADLMLGHPLDTTYNNGPAPFGCQGGGGNLCTFDGKKIVDVAAGGPNTLMPAGPGAPSLNTVVAGGNPISWAPHPNPPPLITPALCAFPHLGGQEPTSIESITMMGLTNLLAPGDPFGIPGAGVPPTGLLTVEQNSFFVGTGGPQATIAACPTYQYRQQVGHWMYLADRARSEIVVVNSNSMRVLKRIAIPDPTELAMSPNLDKLAVSSQATNSVYFVDIAPGSATFHQVVQTTLVGIAPRGIAWDPGNEDILVCNEGSDNVSILSAFSLQVRKVVHRGLHQPFAVAITQRQAGFGFQRNVYFAYILDRTGKVALFESGPTGINGWGYDDIIWQTPYAFTRARAIQPDPLRLGSGVWIAHENQLDEDGNPTGLTGGALSNLVVDSAVVGVVPLILFMPPGLRDMSLKVIRSIGSDQLSGVPLDVAFDDQRNYGALANLTSIFGSGAPAPVNGKSQVRKLGAAGPIVNTNEATYLLVPIRGPGVVDVIKLSTGQRIDTNAFHAGIQSIPASGAVLAMDYFRQ